MPLESPLSGAIAVAAILVLGLPHGALDLHRLRADKRVTTDFTRILVVYLGVAGAMALAWLAFPPLALILFLGTAVAHFTAEAAEDAPGLVAAAFATLLIAVPSASHPQDVAMIFRAMAGAPAADLATKAAGALAIPAGMVLVWAALTRPPSPAFAVEVAAALVALLLLPPLPGFAVFFCLQHSPRHLGHVSRQLGLDLRRTLLFAAPATLGALALGGLFLVWRPKGSEALSAAAFILLSVLTVPHMSAGLLLKTRWFRPLGTVG